MALSTDLEILNRVLRELSGCILQYVREISPWTSADPAGDKLKSVVDQCVERQAQSIALLAEFLEARQARVEFGPFSADLTDLHYVSLKFLLKRLIADQTQIVESLNRAVTLLPGGDETQEVLLAVRQNEQQNLDALKSAAA